MTGLKSPNGKDRRIVFQSPFFVDEVSFYRVCVRVLKQHQMWKFCANCKVQQTGMSLGFQIRKRGCWSIPFLLIMNHSSCYTILSCQEVSWSTFSQFQGVCSRRQANGMGVCFFSIQGVIQKGWWLYQVIALNSNNHTIPVSTLLCTDYKKQQTWGCPTNWPPTNDRPWISWLTVRL